MRILMIGAVDGYYINVNGAQLLNRSLRSRCLLNIDLFVINVYIHRDPMCRVYVNHRKYLPLYVFTKH